MSIAIDSGARPDRVGRCHLLRREMPVPPARPYWKGYLKLSLVACPIALYTGTSSTERVAFRQINKKTGNRVRQQLVDDATREPVGNEDKSRGYSSTRRTPISPWTTMSSTP